MLKICLFSLLVVFIVSCSSKNYDIKKDESFLDTIELIGSHPDIKGLTFVDDFIVKNNKVIVKNVRDDSIFMIYELPDFHLFASFGDKGRGPKELLMPNFVRNNGNMDIIYDFGKNQFFKIDFEKGQFQPYWRSKRLSENPQEMILYNDTCLVIDDVNRIECRIVKYVQDSSIVIYDFPDLQHIKDPQGYRGFMEINPITGEIVYVNQYLRRFDIISLSGQVKSLNIYENTEGPIIKGSKLDYLNSITYYFGVMASPKSIYLYYVGKTGNEIAQNYKIPTYIEEYDWEGNPIRKYRLDRFFKSLRYTEGYFVGVDPNLESPFVLYKIP